MTSLKAFQMPPATVPPTYPTVEALMHEGLGTLYGGYLPFTIA